MEKDEEGKGFEVRDKRKLWQDEDVKDEQGDNGRRQDAHWHEQTHTHDDCSCNGSHTLPEASFINFIAGLSTNVMVSLGILQDPSGESYKDLTVAQYLIDMIAMLQGKTKGNLDDTENKYITDVLSQLRMAYVSVANQP
ncbi:MAG: DUF1844 domain-containing protein [Nitrospirae bacterium]|nr:DUF1844 domain-containing protein [Nitrospirota bacterium]